MERVYKMNIAGLPRELSVCRISDDLCIAAFVLFGDVELTVSAAGKLLEIAPEHDILITAEAKGIPLVHEMARQSGQNTYIVARKQPKLYMRDTFSAQVKSISTAKVQTLYLDIDEAASMQGKRILIVDDVISTGESLLAVEKLVNRAGGMVVGKMTVLAEGPAKDRDDILYLDILPLLDGKGLPIE